MEGFKRDLSQAQSVVQESLTDMNIKHAGWFGERSGWFNRIYGYQQKFFKDRLHIKCKMCSQKKL